MQEDEFEKQVTKNMEGFGVEPSASVWTKVERRIRKEKKRRFVFWLWILLLFLGSGIVTAIIFSQKEGGKIIVANGNTDKNRSIPILPPTKKDSLHIDKKIKEIGKSTKEIKPKKESDISGQTNKNLNKNHPVTRSKKVPYGNTEIIEPVTANEFARPTQKKQALTNKEPSAEKHPALQTKSVAITEEKRISQDFPDNIDTEAVVKKNNIPGLKIEDTVANKLVIADSLSTVLKKEMANKKIQKWKSGVEVSAGRSGFSNGLFSQDKSFDVNAAPGSGQTPDPGPSPVNPSFAGSVGLFIIKEVSNKLALTFGIDYSYMSSQRSIGSKVDSARILSNNFSTVVQVSNFYRPSGTVTNNYTNQFHFIGLSGGVSWQIVHSNKFKLYWENGLGFNRVITSNLLHYNPQLPGYYKDNSLLVKNQFIFSTGLLIPIDKRLVIKPFLSYNLTPVLKYQGSNNTHFSSWGIRLKYIVKK
ncbi:MAG: hypothetical protein ABI091_17045 [Ferruginibacter sp.]